MTPWIAAMIALFVWWFSTGAILMAVTYTDLQGPAARKRLVVLSTPMLLAGLVGVVISADDLSILGVYVAFLSALAVWGWLEITFLTGIITGPNKSELRPNQSEAAQFQSAWATLAYHEILLLLGLFMLAVLTVGSVNSFAFWVFAVLFFARISAKLNLYLGVPKFQHDFLPSALAHLKSYIRVRSMNWLFPISVTALALAIACWMERIYAAQTDAEITGFTLLAALTALALFEHWMMVIPLPDEKLWRWMLPAGAPTLNSQDTNKLKGEHHGL